MLAALTACQGIANSTPLTPSVPTVQEAAQETSIQDQNTNAAKDFTVTTPPPPIANAEATPVPAFPASTPASVAPSVANPTAVPTAVPVVSTPNGVAFVAPTHAKSLPPPHSAQVGQLVYIQQTLNNCGPASVAEVLRFWGIFRTQDQVQAVLRADGNPRGMVPYGVPSYIQSLNMRVVMGVNGDEDMIKYFVSGGFPVIVSQWVSETDHTGHYRPIEGFDDERGGFVSSDPYLGPDHFINYDEFDRIWATNSRRFIVLYPASKEGAKNAIIASSGWDKNAAYQADLEKLQRRLDMWKPRSADGNFRQHFGVLAVTWDEIELGNLDAAASSLREAQAGGANPIVVGWLSQALERAMSGA
jgi:hypothetical protein